MYCIKRLTFYWLIIYIYIYDCENIVIIDNVFCLPYETPTKEQMPIHCISSDYQFSLINFHSPHRGSNLGPFDSYILFSYTQQLFVLRGIFFSLK